MASPTPLTRPWWHKTRRTDFLFLLGLGTTTAFFVVWFTDGKAPNPLLLGTALWLTTASASVPRLVSLILGRWGQPPDPPSTAP